MCLQTFASKVIKGDEVTLSEEFIPVIWRDKSLGLFKETFV